MHILGAAYDGSNEYPCQGFGDDMKYFASFGMSTNRTSRPIRNRENHSVLLKSAKKERDLDVAHKHHYVDDRTLAAISLRNAAVKMLRLRTLGYLHTHCKNGTLKINVPSNKRSQYPWCSAELAKTALDLFDMAHG